MAAKKLYMRTQRDGKRRWEPQGSMYTSTLGKSEVIQLHVTHPDSGNQYIFTVRGNQFEISLPHQDLFASGILLDELEMDP
jgi:hypothetical protein